MGADAPAHHLGERILNAATVLRRVSRIVRCDAYEAMTAERSWRSAISHDAACEELRAMAGTQFDPEAVAALLDEVDGRDGVLVRATDDTDAPTRDIADRVRTLLATG